MEVVEVIFSTSFNGAKCVMKAWNVRTGSRISQYYPENGSDGRHFLAVGNGCVLQAHEGFGKINVWPLNKYNCDSKVRIVAPGRISAFHATVDQKILAFSIDENIYFYLAESGVLRIFRSHFQAVRIIKFSRDGCLLACGGEDGLVSIWNVAVILTHTFEVDPEPLLLFHHHMLPVTDIAFTSGALKVRVTTVSRDRTAKIYDVSSGNMLLSVVFDSSLECIALPSSDTGMYIGQKNGTITEICFSELPKMLEVYYTEAAKPFHNFNGHNKMVTSMAITVDCFHLISGSNDHTIRIWNTSTRHCEHVIDERGTIGCVVTAVLPMCVFHYKFKPKYLFKPFVTKNKNRECAIHINVTKNLYSSLPLSYKQIPKKNLSKDLDNEKEENDNVVRSLTNVNKTLYIFALKRLVHQIAHNRS